ncbi:DUF4129 domain-containing protein [Cryobacterium sp. TMT1-21]|uniref:DUF4129 domain-containing protein n=1 Tax=Cryobacterium shii TaxID=1259235 RepID=A0AAQ2HG52_9MICO|nr:MULTISPECIES: DUF4129 domain-containing protein [Cryobacterium]TFC49790.1 DUF4129 domain-containing protein [Cryobacterium shii]TFC84019.1 DUF4129 domain-containing protein [Cryobacterium sp. TmT2-59]TFD15478.1 DUF4129 domain-containing protein [Cryobacterium sp. TMT1-21]TFD16121.1 DUF4129 domain-containing protein [Cryobacterium sp. TMT4-10]TFD18463.1 DUF4129 domain-containing protein [Cryobacterium sp. TMT2-23]
MIDWGLETMVRGTIPVDPDAPEAQRWLREELAKAPYQAARPTWFDRVSSAVLDWFGSLTAPSGDGLAGWIPLIVTVVLAAIVVPALLIFGLPRLNRRSRLPADLFGVDDRRSAADLRRAALAAASHRDWSLASAEMFRALARELSERTILVALPGTTAHSFAARAAEAFPAETVRLAEAAETFDGVRYLGVVGTEARFLALAALEADLRSARPARREDPAPSALA